MKEEHINKVIETFQKRKEVERYSHVASYEEIEENDFNLNIPRYVDTFIPEPLPDMKQILRDLKAIDDEETKLKEELYDMLDNLTGNKEDMKLIEAHKNILKKKPKEQEYGQMTFEGLL